MSAGVILLLSSLCLASFVSQGQEDESSARKLVESYYASYTARDADALFQLWSGNSTELASRRETIKKFFADNDRIEIKGFAVRKVRIEGDQARVRTSFELGALDVKTGKPATGLGLRNRTFHLVREAGVWKISREESTEDEISRALVAAGTGEARAAAAGSGERVFDGATRPPSAETGDATKGRRENRGSSCKVSANAGSCRPY